MDVRKVIDFKRKKVNEKTSNEMFVSTLKKIKEGDTLLRDEFLSRYTSFMLKVAANTVGRYVDIKNSDEYSIALSAFNEAIDSFDMTKGYNFLLFSEQVIKRRLIDYMRKNKGGKELPFSYFDNNSDFFEKHLLSDSSVSFEDVEIREEIIEYKNTLMDFGITFMDLMMNAPKHEDSRKLCIKIAKVLADDEDLFKALLRHKNIPRNELKNRTRVHSRTIGNHRKYIIALCLILRSNLELSKKYLRLTEKGGR